MFNLRLFAAGIFLFFLTACPAAPTQTVTAVKININGVLLTTLNETRQLDVSVTKSLADQPAGDVTWTSSNTNVVTVDSQGIITAKALVGSSQITASVSGVTSNPILVTVAPVKPNVVVTTDASILSEPVAVNPNAEFAVGYQYTILLDGLEPVVGKIIVGNGEKTIFGKVIAVVAENGKWRTTLEVVPFDDAFNDFQISQPVDLSKTQYVPTQEALATFNVQATGNSFQFTQKPNVKIVATSSKSRVGNKLTQKVNFGPLKCKLEASAAQVDFNVALENTAFEIKPTPPHLESFTWNPTQKLLKFAEGSIQTHLATTAILKIGAAGKLSCKLQVIKPQFPLPGFLGLVGSVHLPIGLGLSIEAEAPLENPTLNVAGDFDIGYDAGFCFGSACPATPVTKLTKFNLSNQKIEFKPNLTNPLTSNTAIKISVFPFVYLQMDIAPTLEIPNATPLSKTILDWKAGLTAELEVKNSNVLPRGDDAYISDYTLKTKAVISLLEDDIDAIKAFLKLENVLPDLKLSFSDKFAESPKGTVSATQTGNNASFEIALNLQTTSFPFLGYNLADVRVYRKKANETTLALIANTAAVTGQSNYTIPWQVDPALNPNDEFIVLVKTKLPVLPFVVVDQVRMQSSCQSQSP